jgi:ATP-dependent Clp protease ATP-binding subunit ClpX
VTTRNAYCSFCRKSYRAVGPLVEGPPLVEGRGNAYICGECIVLCQSIIDQEKRRRGARRDDVREKLGRLVAGQEEARRALADAVLQHPEGPPRSGGLILLVGPSRGSKVYLARALAHALGVPFAFCKAGPDGPNPEALFQLFLQAGDFDLEALRRGVVYLDGVDRPGGQEHLLGLLAGTAGASPQGLPTDASAVLFLGSGTFRGLDEVVARRGGPSGRAVTSDDLAEWGLDPDLARRLQAVIRVAPLDEETLLLLVTLADLSDLL